MMTRIGKRVLAGALLGVFAFGGLAAVEIAAAPDASAMPRIQMEWK